MNFVQNGGVFVVNDALAFYSLSGGDQCANNLTITPNNPVTFAAATSASTPAISTRTQFTVGGNGIVNLGTGSTTYEILTINNTQLYLRAIIGGSGNAWYQRLRPTDGSVVNPPPPVENTKSKLDFPVTFDDTANFNYTLSDFGRVLTKDSTISNNRLKATTKTIGAEGWGGTTLGSGATPSLKNALSNTGAPKFSVLVKSPVAGLTMRMKIETENNTNGTTQGEFVEKDVTNLTANDWDSLVFDFSTGTIGNWNVAKTYTRLSIFFEFNVAGSGKTFLWDNVRLLGYSATNTQPIATKLQIDLPITFNDTTVNYNIIDFEGNVTTDTIIAANDKAKKTIKTDGSPTWAGTTMGDAIVSAGALKTAFSNAAAPRISVRVYTPAAGIKVRLKIENAADNTKTVETDATSTVAGWQTLNFNFANAATNNGAQQTAAWSAANTYNKLSIFFDYGNSGDGRVYLWDDVMLIP